MGRFFEMKRSVRKSAYKVRRAALSKEARKAKAMVERICLYLAKVSGRRFWCEMDARNRDFEGHVLDSGKYAEVPESGNAPESCVLSEAGEDIGMVFWGGHFPTRKYGAKAESKAWVSLLEDCIGIGELGSDHTLSRSLKEGFGPEVDLDCGSVEELELKLSAAGC